MIDLLDEKIYTTFVKIDCIICKIFSWKFHFCEVPGSIDPGNIWVTQHWMLYFQLTHFLPFPLENIRKLVVTFQNLFLSCKISRITFLSITNDYQKSSLHKKCFPSRISSINATTPAGDCGFGHITEEIRYGKPHFLCSALIGSRIILPVKIRES